MFFCLFCIMKPLVVTFFMCYLFLVPIFFSDDTQLCDIVFSLSAHGIQLQLLQGDHNDFWLIFKLPPCLLPPSSLAPKKGGNLKNPHINKLPKYDCMQKMSPVASKLIEIWQFIYTKVT